MSDTPRTDALDCDMLKEWGNISYLHMRTHAERLERELAAMTKERDEWKAKAEANERDAERLRFLVAEAYLCSDFGVDTETHTVRWECSKHRERVCGLYDALDIEIDRAKKRKILV